jgi:hypothetical protein
MSNRKIHFTCFILRGVPENQKDLFIPLAVISHMQKLRINTGFKVTFEDYIIVLKSNVSIFHYQANYTFCVFRNSTLFCTCKIQSFEHFAVKPLWAYFFKESFEIFFPVCKTAYLSKIIFKDHNNVADFNILDSFSCL